MSDIDGYRTAFGGGSSIVVERRLETKKHTATGWNVGIITIGMGHLREYSVV